VISGFSIVFFGSTTRISRSVVRQLAWLN